MSLIINCDRCGDELKELGALMIGPPHPSGHYGAGMITRKWHLCVICFGSAQAWMEKKL